VPEARSPKPGIRSLAVKGRHPSQTAPPTFVAITNAPDAIHFSYRRYVTNQLRKAFGFEGVPIRVHYKAKRKRGEKRSADDRE
jgi:predicted GTPase